MQTRTWPYGTAKQVIVREFKWASNRGQPVSILLVEDDWPVREAYREAYVLLNDLMGQTEYQPGQRGTITFTQGGPTGGYWKFSPETGQNQPEK
jgi:hypothetical protein